MNLTNIEKAAKLMGYGEPDEIVCDTLIWKSESCLDSGLECTVTQIFNPYTNKADLMDVECALGIDVEWFEFLVRSCGGLPCGELTFTEKIISDYHDKFTARAHAVMAVVEQIYDRREG